MASPLNLQQWLILKKLDPSFLQELKLAFVCGDNKNKESAFMITKDDNVYSCGYNYRSLLGIGHTFEEMPLAELPEQINQLCDKRIKDFAFGVTYMMALAQDGKIYTWGANASGQLGNNCFEDSVVPVLVNVADKIIVQIACNEDRAMALTNEGQVYAWGKLNHVQPAALISSPLRMDLPEDIVQIACTYSQNFVMTGQGNIYMWIYDCDKSSIMKINFHENVTVEKIACGYSHMLILTSTGVIYAWGDNDQCQLSWSKDRVAATDQVPIKANQEMMGIISDIGASNISSTSAALNQDGRVFMWGVVSNVNKEPLEVPSNNIHEAFGFYGVPSTMPSPLNFENYVEEKTMKNRLKKAFDNPTSSDLVIKVQDKPIHVHKAILKIRSEYFKTMFQKGRKENEQAIIVKDDFSYEAYKCFLKFLYTDELELPSEGTCEEVLNMANAFLMPALKKKYSKLIKQRITVQNVLSLYRASVIFDAPELKASCFNFAVKSIAATMEAICALEIDDPVMKEFLIEAVKSKKDFSL